ncbi:MAG: thiamine pyrophosphate-dependent enzyme [Elusimicrobiota bacterium]
MQEKNWGTNAINTWCPGCGNFAILNSIKSVLKSLVADNILAENIVLVSGIGCGAKIVDYINANSVYSIHGRVLPVAEGIKLANPQMKVIGLAGDGDTYGEGMEHLVFAAKRNIDITMIVHNNRVYGLTTGQYTPTSPLGYKGRSTPQGSKETPINPLEIMLASGASFISRGTSTTMELLKKLMREAIMHKGFALVDILQVCVTFFNMYEYYNKNVYELAGHDPADYGKAMQRIREWNYSNTDAKIPLGVFYKKEIPTFEEYYLHLGKETERSQKIHKILENTI